MSTINYSEQINAFQSFMDIRPVEFIEFNDKLYFVDSNGDVLSYSNKNPIEYNNLFLRSIVNGDFHATKTFDNVELFSTTSNNILIDSAKFYTSNQQSQPLLNENADKRENTYRLAIPRGVYDERMRDKYLICDYSVKGNSDGVAFSIPYIKTRYRYSKI